MRNFIYKYENFDSYKLKNAPFFSSFSFYTKSKYLDNTQNGEISITQWCKVTKHTWAFIYKTF